MRGLLAAIDGDQVVSQRRLAHRLGIALGLTNLLLRRVIAKGWVKVVHVRRNRVRYLLTPIGIAAKARLTREYLEGTLQFYAEARERVNERFSELSSQLVTETGTKRIVFYGTGEVAEIGYVSLQETDLQLVGVVDPARAKPFFGLPVHPPKELTPQSLNGCPFDRLVVMSFEVEGVVARLESQGIHPDRVFWI